MKSTEFLLIFLYRNAFDLFRMGKASAIAWVMFLIIVVFHRYLVQDIGSLGVLWR